MGQEKREKSKNWRGGKVLCSTSGYVKVYIRPREYQYEHRVIAEKMLGRKLKSNELVHHKNHLKNDNRPENLEIVNRFQHAELHKPKKINRVTYFYLAA